MRITFSARAWMLSAAVGFATLPAAVTSLEASPIVPTSSRTTKATSTENRAKIIPVAAASEPRRFNATGSAKPAKPANDVEANKIRQTAATSGTDVSGSSEVQRKLEELYRKNGREMPPMQVNQLPEQNLKQKLPPLPQQVQQAQGVPPQAVAQSRMGRFFQNINPFPKKENDERPKHVESMPADVARQQQAVQSQGVNNAPNRAYQQPQAQPQFRPQQGNNFVPPPPVAPAPEPAQFKPPALLSPPIGPVGRINTLPSTGEIPEFRPAVQLPQESRADQLPKALVAPPIPKLPETLTTQEPEVPRLSEAASEVPFTGAVEVKKPTSEMSDDLDNAFPEMSETEADTAKRNGKTPAAATPAPVATAPLKTEIESPATTEADANPFTGLKLEVEEAVKALDGKAPLLPTAKSIPDLKLPEPIKLPEPASLSTPATLSEPAKVSTPAKLSEDADDDDDDRDLAASKSEPSSEANAKMKLISQRKELKGLKGFCPVILRDNRDLLDARPQFKTIHLGKVYNFSSSEALQKFTQNPKLYAPIAGGRDVVALKENTEDIEGQLDHAAWFKDRLYLFGSQKTKEAFELTPSKYAVEE